MESSELSPTTHFWCPHRGPALPSEPPGCDLCSEMGLASALPPETPAHLACPSRQPWPVSRLQHWAQSRAGRDQHGHRPGSRHPWAAQPQCLPRPGHLVRHRVSGGFTPEGADPSVQPGWSPPLGCRQLPLTQLPALRRGPSCGSVAVCPRWAHLRFRAGPAEAASWDKSPAPPCDRREGPRASRPARSAFWPCAQPPEEARGGGRGGPCRPDSVPAVLLPDL